MVDLNTIIKNAQLAIEDWEDVEAKKILKQLRQIIAEEQIAQRDPQSYSKLQKWIVYLQLMAFPNLSDEECEQILKNSYLESFAINVQMERQLISKLFYVPYLVRDELRQTLKRGLTANMQNFGGSTIGQWIQEFEKQYDIHTRNESATVQFVLQNPKARTLSKTEQNILKDILHTYDYLLVSNIPALGEDLINLVNAMPKGNVNNISTSGYQIPQPIPRTSNSYASVSEFSAANEKKNLPFEQITLAEALKDYPHVGEQNITNEQIKLHYFPTPVRPSIKNWITDFHDALGSVKHSPIDRGNFLFHSENGKKLSAADRQKLGTILKALDEQTLLTIDPNAQVVVFGNTDEIRIDNGLNTDATKTEFDSVSGVELRRESSQQYSASHDVFGDLSPIHKNEAIQDKHLEDRVQGFFAKQTSEQNSVISHQPASTREDDRSSMRGWSSAISPTAIDKKMPMRTEIKQPEEKLESQIKENYFSIPQSKPPIGSEHFNVINTDESRIADRLKTDQIQRDVKAQSVHENVAMPISEQDRDSMSDDFLYKMIQEKKIKQPEMKQEHNFSADSISFSSGQELPAEKSVQPVQAPVEQVRQSVQTVKLDADHIQRSPYHITPADNSYSKSDDLRKTQKNVVDLKN